MGHSVGFLQPQLATASQIVYHTRMTQHLFTHIDRHVDRHTLIFLAALKSSLSYRPCNPHFAAYGSVQRSRV